MADYTIDLDRVLRSKMGDKARYVPRPLVRWLKRIIHQDELNQFITQEGEKQGVPWLKDSLEFLNVTLRVEGRENLPAADTERRYTFVSNHPLGGQDGLALGAVLGEHFGGNVKYLVNDLLMNLHGLAPLFIPINKTGKQSRDFPRMVEEGFKSSNHIIMFPAGLCSRREKGIIRDLEWQKTFITKSIETERDVVPIHFSGRNSDRFYRLAGLCKRLGLKFNIAMVFLVDEMFRNAHKTFTLTIGKPIPWQTFSREKTAKEWAAVVREQVYSLSKDS